MLNMNKKQTKLTKYYQFEIRNMFMQWYFDFPVQWMNIELCTNFNTCTKISFTSQFILIMQYLETPCTDRNKIVSVQYRFKWSKWLRANRIQYEMHAFCLCRSSYFPINLVRGVFFSKKRNLPRFAKEARKVLTIENQLAIQTDIE